MDAKLILHLSEVISTYFREITLQMAEPVEVLKYLKALCQLGFSVNNLVHLDQKDFALFCAYLENYYRMAFDSPLNQTLLGLYTSEDEEMRLQAEEILGFGVSWVKSVMENPGIWVSDMLFSDRDSEATGQAEEYLEKTFFNEERIHTILKVIVTQYLILTREELALW